MPLLADLPLIVAADFWEGIIPIIFFVLWGVGQLLGNRDEAQPKKRPQRPPQPLDGMAPQPVGGMEGVPGPPRQEDALRSEVEEFLRRAQGQPAQAKRPPQERQPPKRKQLSRPTRDKAQPPERVRQHVPVKEQEMRSESVAEHVAQHLNTQDLVAHSEALGDEVALADDRLESHLHEKFGHQLGKLQHREAEVSTSKRTDVAAELADMLRSPQGIRQLIVANEILRRPEW